MYRFENPISKRWYQIHIQEDMFSQHTLVISHGGHGHRVGATIRVYGYKDQEEMQRALAALIRRRTARGYMLRPEPYEDLESNYDGNDNNP